MGPKIALPFTHENSQPGIFVFEAIFHFQYAWNSTLSIYITYGYGNDTLLSILNLHIYLSRMDWIHRFPKNRTFFTSLVRRKRVENSETSFVDLLTIAELLRHRCVVRLRGGCPKFSPASLYSWPFLTLLWRVKKKMLSKSQVVARDQKCSISAKVSLLCYVGVW